MATCKWATRCRESCPGCKHRLSWQAVKWRITALEQICGAHVTGPKLPIRIGSPSHQISRKRDGHGVAVPAGDVCDIVAQGWVRVGCKRFDKMRRADRWQFVKRYIICRSKLHHSSISQPTASRLPTGVKSTVVHQKCAVMSTTLQRHSAQACAIGSSPAVCASEMPAGIIHNLCWGWWTTKQAGRARARTGRSQQVCAASQRRFDCLRSQAVHADCGRMPT